MIDKAHLAKLHARIFEAIEAELEEVSTSGATPGYLTPNAFRPGKHDEPMVRKNIGVDEDDFKPVPMGEKLSEARSRYLNFKMGEGTAPQKIGRAIYEINSRLQEIDHLLQMNHRLKTENNLGSTDMWKRTLKHLTRMENKMLRMSHRIQELKA